MGVKQQLQDASLRRSQAGNHVMDNTERVTAAKARLRSLDL